MRQKRREKEQEIKKERGGEQRNCVFSLRVMNRVLIDPETGYHSCSVSTAATGQQGGEGGEIGGGGLSVRGAQRRSETQAE